MRRRTLGAAVLLVVALTACGRESARSPLGPGGGTGPLAMTFRTAPRPAGGPALGPVDTIRVALRGELDGAFLDGAVIPIGRTQTTFQATLEAPSAVPIEAVAAAFGNRPVSGLPQGGGSGRGVLYRASRGGLVVVPGGETSAELTFTPFVPEFRGQTIDEDQSTHAVWWSGLPGAAAWRLTRRIDGQLRPDTTVTDTLLVAVGLPASYQVRAIDALGQIGAPSDVVTLLPDLPPPPAGLGLSYGLVGNAPVVELTWLPPQAAIDALELQRSVDGSDFVPWRSLAADARITHDEQAPDGFRYDYRIRSRRGPATSTWDGPVGADIPLNPPTRFRASPGRASILLEWDERSASETAIEIERRISDAGPFTTVASLDKDAGSWTDTQPPVGAPIQYRIRVVRGAAVASAWVGPITTFLQGP